MNLRTDDAPHGLRSVWLGPDQSVRWPVDWTYIEWAIFAGVALAAAVVSAVAMWPLLEWYGLIPAPVAGVLAGVLARRWTAPLISADRTVRHMARMALASTRLVVWAHGPADLAVVAAAAGLWTVLAVFVVPVLWGPALAWWGAAAWLATRGGRWVVHRFESPERYWRRTEARAERRPAGAAVRVEIPVTTVEVTP